MRYVPLLLAAFTLLLRVAVLPAQTLPSSSPDAAALKSASALVDEVFKSELAAAKTPDQKHALVTKLLDAAKDEKAADLYAILVKARDIAIESGNVAGCNAALAALETAFDLDTVKLRSDAYLALSRNVHTPADRKTLAPGLSAAIHAAVSADRFDIARPLAQLALASAQLSNDTALAQAAAADLRNLREIEAAYVQVKATVATLAQKPADPAANLQLGEYRCFIQNDWKHGLPMLAKGSDAALKALAEKEAQLDKQLFGSPPADTQLALADGWWDAADSLPDSEKHNAQVRAATWYQLVLPSLSGLQKIKVDQRLAKVAADTARANTPAGNTWVVLLRSADPSLWNTNTDKGHNVYAISLDTAPKGIQFVRIAVPSGDCVIMPLTTERLARQGVDADSRFGLNGTLNFDCKAYHLGIYSLDLPKPKGCVETIGRALSFGAAGWGFGNHCYRDDNQGYGWAGKEIGPTVFEIAVKTSPLTEEEKKKLVGEPATPAP